MANGLRKFSFETINTELQVARFADNGWINIYDVDKKLYSYRFDNASNLLVNITTPDGIMLDASGHIVGNNLLLNFETLDESAMNSYVLAETTATSLPADSRLLQSHLVTYDGKFIDESPATDLWTTIDLSAETPVLTNTAYTMSAIEQPLQLLGNSYTSVAKPVQSYVQAAVDTSLNYFNPLNVVKMTQILRAVDTGKVVNLAVNYASNNNVLSLYGMCSNLFNGIKKLFAA
jgi:hypothetical protein